LCPNGAFDKCNYILNYIGDGQGSLKLDCVLPEYDFTNEDTQNALSTQQVDDLTDWLCTAPPPIDPPSSMSFDGTIERIVAPNNIQLEFNYNAPFTLSTYAKINSSKTHHIFNKFTPAGQDIGIYSQLLSNNKLRFFLGNDSTVKGILIETTSSLLLNTWYRLDFVYKGTPTAINAEIWVNGIKQGVTVIADTLGNNNINDPSLSWFFGCSNGITNGLDGLLHEIKMYKTALTGTDIDTDNKNLLDFNNGINPSYTPIKPLDLAFRNRTGAGALFGAIDWVFPDEGTGLGSQSVLMEFIDKSNDIPLSL
jgi:hypothetical protein